MAKSSNDSEPDIYKKYDEEQDEYWEKFRQELETIKEELDSSNFELSQGLNISRQLVVDFMNKSRRGLPIDRSNLKRLWHYLTSVELLKGKRLSKEIKKKRKEIGNDDLDRLLMAAGFLPETPVLNPDPNRYDEISRVVSSLSEFPKDKDGSAFSRLINEIGQEITQALPKDEDIQGRTEAEDWLKKQAAVNQRISKKFWKAINKLFISGKNEFTYSELFQLLQSIKNNSKWDNSCLKMRISKCEFTTLTFSLQDYCELKEIKKELDRAALDAENEFGQDDNEIKEISLLDPVISASITCLFSSGKKQVIWQHSSSATHFENMLAALEKGLGYLGKLDLIHFSNVAQGKQKYSLAKNSVTYRPKIRESNDRDVRMDKSYSGVWVDRSLVIGSLQAALIAVRSWLCDFLVEPEQQENYYQVCQDVAAIEENLLKVRKALDNSLQQHSITREIGKENNLFISNYLRTEINNIIRIKEEKLKDNEPINKLFRNNLQRNLCTACLMGARSAHTQGDLQKAKNYLDYLSNEALAENAPAKILVTIEKLIGKWLSGSSEFEFTYEGRQKLFDKKFKPEVRALKDYIAAGHDRGRFNFDVCLAASELFGNFARLDFYFCQADNLNDVERLAKISIPNFLNSAYYSAKIGRRQRAADWLAYVSRSYCRLGEIGKAKDYADLAEQVLMSRIEPQHKQRSRLAVLAEINLARGELLLINGEYKEAIPYFLESLKGAIYIGFICIIADSLYGIARAARHEGNYRIVASLEKVFDQNAFQGTKLRLNEKNQAWEENKIAADVIRFLNNLENIEQDWSSVADEFENQAKRIWHKWFVDNHGEGKHPIEIEIERGQFLNRLK
jgi:hypothetical protein